MQNEAGRSPFRDVGGRGGLSWLHHRWGMANDEHHRFHPPYLRYPHQVPNGALVEVMQTILREILRDSWIPFKRQFLSE
jgi:hypothetical protein